jgi:hypothetical protein
VLDFLSPKRVADRLVLRVTDLLDDPLSLPLSVVARQALEDWLAGIAEADEYTQLAKDGAMYAAYVGYALRLIEETDGKARSLDRSLVARLEPARAAAPEKRRRELQEVIADPETPDHERRMFERWLSRDDELVEFEVGARAALQALIDDSVGQLRWIDDDRRFSELSGYRPDVWRIIVLNLTRTLNDRQNDEADRTFPWEAIQELVRFGYLIRVGDALNEERWVLPIDSSGDVSAP